MEHEMTTEEVAAELGVSVETIRKRIQRGQMQARRVGARLLLVPRSEVDRWRDLGRLRPWGGRALRRRNAATDSADAFEAMRPAEGPHP